MSSARPRYFAVILAAGSGSRFKKSADNPSVADTPKQYQRIAGKTLVEHSVQRVCATVLPRVCVLVHSAGDSDIKRQHTTLPVDYVVGGAERMDSVLNALQHLAAHGESPAQADDFVMIHDAARPCVSRDDIASLIKQTKNHPVGGLLATPVTATVKRSTEFLVEKTIPRDSLWLAQTPQLFRFGILKDALAAARDNDLNVTDDAHALELQGHQPLIVRGNASNIKVTYADDLQMAKFYLSQGG